MDPFCGKTSVLHPMQVQFLCLYDTYSDDNKLWIFSPSSNVEINELFPFLVLLQLLTEHLIKLLICIFPLFWLWGSVLTCPLASGLDSTLPTGFIANTAKMSVSLFQQIRGGIFAQYRIGVEWDGGGQFSALLLPEVDYVQIIST